jgi:hypothetical protein
MLLKTNTNIKDTLFLYTQSLDMFGAFAYLFIVGLVTLLSFWFYFKALEMTVSGAPVIKTLNNHVEKNGVGRPLMGLLLMVFTGAIIAVTFENADLLDAKVAMCILVIIAIARWIKAFIEFRYKKRTLKKTEPRARDRLNFISDKAYMPSGIYD